MAVAKVNASSLKKAVASLSSFRNVILVLAVVSASKKFLWACAVLRKFYPRVCQYQGKKRMREVVRMLLSPLPGGESPVKL